MDCIKTQMVRPKVEVLIFDWFCKFLANFVKIKWSFSIDKNIREGNGNLLTLETDDYSQFKLRIR